MIRISSLLLVATGIYISTGINLIMEGPGTLETPIAIGKFIGIAFLVTLSILIDNFLYPPQSCPSQKSAENE